MKNITEIAAKNVVNVIVIGLVIVLQGILSDVTRKASSGIKEEAMMAARRIYNSAKEKRSSTAA